MSIRLPDLHSSLVLRSRGRSMISVVGFVIFFSLHYCFAGNLLSYQKNYIEMGIEEALELYNSGDCSIENFEKAKQYLQDLNPCCNTTNPDKTDQMYLKHFSFATLHLAHLNFYGLKDGRHRNLNKAIELYKQEFKKIFNHYVKVASALGLGLCYYDLSEYQNAKIYVACVYAQKDFADLKISAAFIMGIMHYYGHGFTKDLDLAKLFFEEAFDQEVRPDIIAKAAQYLKNIKGLKNNK